jgi:hypothetical protein
MKLFKLIFGVFMVITVNILFMGCVTPKPDAIEEYETEFLTPQPEYLTWGAIRNDIGGEENLGSCLYLISTDVVLSYVENLRDRDFGDGVVHILNQINHDIVLLNGSSLGNLREKDVNGNPVEKIRIQKTKSGDEVRIISILFGETNIDEYLDFAAFYDDDDDNKFELVTDSNGQVTLGGLKYDISYDGNELPYLIYKKTEKSIVKKITREFGSRDVIEEKEEVIK